MEATILFPEINMYDSISRRIPTSPWNSKSKRRRLNKKIKKQKSEKEGAVKKVFPPPSSSKKPPPSSRVLSSSLSPLIGLDSCIVTKLADGRGRVQLDASGLKVCARCMHRLDVPSLLIYGSVNSGDDSVKFQAMSNNMVEDGVSVSPEQNLLSNIHRRYCLRPQLRF